MSDQTLTQMIQLELDRQVASAAAGLAGQLAQRAAGHVAAVVFYGSALGDGALDGVLDFYVLVDRVRDWPGPRLAALANRLLPPNVGYLECCIDGQSLRAKYAVMSLAQFCQRMSARTIDTSLWARFSQPCACVWARSAADRAAVAGAVQQAVITAASWAAKLGPESGSARDFWHALFARTYRAELRIEGTARGADLVARDAGRYARLLPAAWIAAGIEFDATGNGTLHPRLSQPARAAAGRRWWLRRRSGRPLNLLRLIKAAFTFDGAMDYAVWKIERHAGVRVELRPWQRRHPLLAAPCLYWRLRRLGLLR